jgi:hypothetical protein
MKKGKKKEKGSWLKINQTTLGDIRSCLRNSSLTYVYMYMFTYIYIISFIVIEEGSDENNTFK